MRIDWKQCGALAALACFVQVGFERSASADFSHNERWASEQGGVVNPSSWLAGDFNGDGTDDLAYVFECGTQICIDVHVACGVNRGPSDCQVLIANGNSGAFELERWISNAGAWPSTYQAVAGDFNADGYKDIAIVSNVNGGINIDVYESQPGLSSFAGPYHRAVSQGSYLSPGTFLAGNFDGLGADDIAFAFQDGTGTDIDVHNGPTTSCSGNNCPSFNGPNRWESRNETFAMPPSAWLSPGNLDFISNSSLAQADLLQAFGTSGGIELDVELASSATFGSAVWAQNQGGYVVPSEWTVGHLGGRASALFAFDDNGGTISIDTHTSLGDHIASWRYATQQGSWLSGMQFLGGDFNGDGQGDVVATFDCGDGNLCFDVHVNDLMAPEATGCGTIEPGTELAVGGTITSCNGQFTLSMQHDGNLVLYNGPPSPTTAVWSSDTSNTTGLQAVMQASDGNFVVYDANRNQVWTSNTGGNPGAFVSLNNDGTMSINSATGTVLWRSLTTNNFDVATNGGCCPADPNLSAATSFVGAMDQNQANFYTKTGALDHSFALPGGSSLGGDSKVVFDRSSGRWFISVMWTTTGSAKSNNAVKFFVSSDATATNFSKTSVPIVTNGSLDDPNITVTSDKVVVNAGSNLWVINKSALIAGNAAQVSPSATNLTHGDQVWGVQYGATTPSTAYMVAYVDSTDINWISVTGTPAQRNVVVTQHVLSVPALANSPTITEQGGNSLENFGVLGMWEANNLWWSRTEGCGSFTCVRMFDIATNSDTATSFDFSMSGTFLWAAAPGIDKNGNMWAIMSTVSPTTSPGLAVAGKLTNGDYRAPAPLVAGQTPYTGSCDNTGFCRWGDYYGASQDPSDGTVWLTGMYGAQNNNFGIKLMHVESWK